MPKHNANEGERCTYRKTSSKRPLLFSITTAFILLSPTAAANASLAFLPYGTERTPLGLRPQQQTTSQLQVLPRSYRDLLSPASATPSLDDINNLESSIASTQKQLNTLRALLPKDPTQLNTLNRTINAAQTRLDNLNTKLAKAKADYSTYLKAQATLTSALSKYDAALLKENNLLLALTQATSNYDAALAALNAQIQATNTARANLEIAQTNYSNAENLYNSATLNVQAQELLTANAKSELDTSELNFLNAQQELTNATNANNQAQLNLQTAQSNYDTNLIPDPTWTAPTYQKENTRLVPYTEIEIVRTQVPTTTLIATGGVKAEVFNRQGYNNAPPLPTANEVPIHTETVSTIDFNWGSGQVLNSGRSEDVIIRFTGNLLVPKDGYYQFYAPADDGTKLEIAGMNVIDDWYNKGGGGTISDPVYIKAGIFYPFTFHYYEDGGGAAVGLYTYSPEQGFSVVPSTWMGSSAEQQTTYEEVITYEEVTKYREEIYYTTEPLLVEGTLDVKINEGGQATFTAPEGAVFISSNLRYEAKDRPECGVDIQPNLQGNQITISANNSIWGDPCGGWYKHIIGTISYLGQPTAPLIKNPALLPALEEAQQEATAAEQLLIKEEQETTVAREALDTAEQAYSEASTELLTNKSKVTEAQEVLNTSSNAFNSAKTTKEQEEQTLSTVQQTEQTTSATKTSTEQQYQTAKQETATSTQERTQAEQTLQTATSTALTSYQVLSTEPQLDLTPIQQIIDTEPPLPEPEPEPEEQGSAEIPAVIENLMDINLAAVDPTELTEAQAEQLVAAALETFETAVEGSPEYEQALDALFLAAQQDDIQVDPTLASIPGVGEAAKAVVAIFNLIGNVGADISPVARKEAQTLVVTTLVVGQIAQAAAMASASSGSSFRRK